jgi:glucokinase
VRGALQKHCHCCRTTIKDYAVSLKVDDRPVIGVDLGGTNIAAGVVSASNKVLGMARTKTKAAQGADAVLERIVKTVLEALAKADLSPQDVGGLGIGAPGTVDTRRGVVEYAVNLRWTNLPLAKRLTEALDLPVRVDNDVNVGTWGEFVAGSGKGCRNMLGVFIGTGIGGGLVLDGKLYSGHFGSAGEIGHTVIHADGPLGRRTLENCASRTAVANLIVQLVQAHHPSRIIDIVGGKVDRIRSGAIAQALAEDDLLVRQVVEQSARYVGVAIANAVTVMSLQRVILGGGLPEALGEPYARWVRDGYHAAVFPESMKQCEVRLGKLGDSAGVIGAALLARDCLVPGNKLKAARE